MFMFMGMFAHMFGVSSILFASQRVGDVTPSPPYPWEIMPHLIICCINIDGCGFLIKSHIYMMFTNVLDLAHEP